MLNLFKQHNEVENKLNTLITTVHNLEYQDTSGNQVINCLLKSSRNQVINCLPKSAWNQVISCLPKLSWNQVINCLLKSSLIICQSNWWYLELVLYTCTSSFNIYLQYLFITCTVCTYICNFLCVHIYVTLCVYTTFCTWPFLML